MLRKLRVSFDRSQPQPPIGRFTAQLLCASISRLCRARRAGSAWCGPQRQMCPHRLAA